MKPPIIAELRQAHLDFLENTEHQNYAAADLFERAARMIEAVAGLHIQRLYGERWIAADQFEYALTEPAKAANDAG